jgi:hypothetical protein
MKAPQRSLLNWGKQKEYRATTRAKREGKAKGKQFVAQPKKIANKVRRYRNA